MCLLIIIVALILLFIIWNQREGFDKEDCSICKASCTWNPNIPENLIKKCLKSCDDVCGEKEGYWSLPFAGGEVQEGGWSLPFAGGYVYGPDYGGIADKEVEADSLLT